MTALEVPPVDSATVKVPCSTSNLGSGFDTLGLALNLHTRVTLRRTGRSATRLGGNATSIDGAQELCADAVNEFFAFSEAPAFGVEVSVSGDVPVARGLGFSATVRAGIIVGLSALTNTRLRQDDILRLVTKLEGHPDNASPAVLGGFTVSGAVDNATRCLRFDVEEALQLVTLIPKFHVRTEQARGLLPKHFAKADAAHALNRSALIVAAFASKNYEALSGLFDDRFHQPHRLKIVPQLNDVIGAGVSAGALGGFLSGSGSTIICLTLASPDGVAKAMQSELPESEVKVLTPENNGLRIENDE